MYSESKEPSRPGWRGREGRFCSAQWMARASQTERSTDTYPDLFSALNCHRHKLRRPGQLALFYTQNAANSPGLPQRTAHNSHCLLNLSLFQKNPMNTIMLSNFLDISKLSHSEYFYIFILLLICQKIKKLSEENLYFIIFLTWLRARKKPTKKKKRLWLLYGVL